MAFFIKNIFTKCGASRRNALLAMLFVIAGAGVAHTETTATPAVDGPVLLTVGGDIAIPNQDDLAVFDRARLESLPQQTFTTSTNWTEGTQTFSGPALSDVLAAAGAGEGSITAIALNDYAVAIARSEIGEDAPIIATRIDGEPFSIRNKGPLWIVFPFDSDPVFQTELTYSLSVWQLAQLIVTEK